MPKLAELIPEGTIATHEDGRKAVFSGGKWNLAPTDIDTAAPGASYMAAGGAAPKLSPAENKDLSSYRSEAQTASATRADAQRFSALNKTTPTGGFYGLPIVRDVRAFVDPKVGEMKAITEKLTPTMRTPGSGTMSDADAAMYRASTVGLDKLGPTNGAIVKVIDAGSRRSADHAAFMETWAKRNGSLLGAQDAWSSYAEANPLYKSTGGNTEINPVQPWKQWFGLEGQQAPKKGGNAQVGAPAKGVIQYDAQGKRIK